MTKMREFSVKIGSFNWGHVGLYENLGCFNTKRGGLWVSDKNYGTFSKE